MKTQRRSFTLVMSLVALALYTGSCDLVTENEEASDPMSFTGTWTGTLSFSTADPGGCGGVIEETAGVTFVLSQSDSTVTATVDFDDDPDGPEALPPFTVNNGSGTMDLGDEPCFGTPGGTANTFVQFTLGEGTLTVAVSGTECRGCPSGSGDEAVATITGGGTLTLQP